MITSEFLVATIVPLMAWETFSVKPSPCIVIEEASLMFTVGTLLI